MTISIDRDTDIVGKICNLFCVNHSEDNVSHASLRAHIYHVYIKHRAWDSVSRGAPDQPTKALGVRQLCCSTCFDRLGAMRLRCQRFLQRHDISVGTPQYTRCATAIRWPRSVTLRLSTHPFPVQQRTKVVQRFPNDVNNIVCSSQNHAVQVLKPLHGLGSSHLRNKYEGIRIHILFS